MTNKEIDRFGGHQARSSSQSGCRFCFGRSMPCFDCKWVC